MLFVGFAVTEPRAACVVGEPVEDIGSDSDRGGEEDDNLESESDTGSVE